MNFFIVNKKMNFFIVNKKMASKKKLKKIAKHDDEKKQTDIAILTNFDKKFSSDDFDKLEVDVIADFIIKKINSQQINCTGEFISGVSNIYNYLKIRVKGYKEGTKEKIAYNNLYRVINSHRIWWD